MTTTVFGFTISYPTKRERQIAKLKKRIARLDSDINDHGRSEVYMARQAYQIDCMDYPMKWARWQQACVYHRNEKNRLLHERKHWADQLRELERCD